MNDRYDVVIAGGGPSGATAALVLARQGLSVALFDRSRFPRIKPCAGAISGRAAKILAELHGAEALPQLARATTRACRMFDGPKLLAEASGSEELAFVDRGAFDLFLVDAARAAGCRVFEQRKMVHVDAQRCEIQLDSGEVVRASAIVGADGVRSGVREAITRRKKNWRCKMGFGLVADVPLEWLKSELRDDCRRVPHIIFGILPWGYGWVFPRGPVASVGVGGALGEGAQFRKALQWLLREYLCEDAWDRVDARGHQFPFGAPASNPGHGNILLTGDAAGLVEPVTGEGIAFAMESGRLAATAILAAMSSGNAELAGGNYNRSIRRHMLGQLRQASVAQWFLFSSVCRPAAMRSLRRHPNLIANYLEVVAGKMSYPGYVGRLFRELMHC